MTAALISASPHTGAALVTSTSPLWYSTRATGLIALVLITLSVVLGLLTSVRFARPNWPRFVTVGLHRNLSLLVLTFVGLHIVTTVADSYAHIHLLDAVVPFVSSYRPIWLGLGAASFDLLLAVAITSLLRTRVGHRLWRPIHWLAYLCWPTAVMHSLGTGTDTRQRWVLAVTASCVAAVLAAGAWRLAAGSRQRGGMRAAVAGGTAVALVAGIAWLAGGPLNAGWARRAGTPVSLLAGSAGSAGSLGSPNTQGTSGSLGSAGASSASGTTGPQATSLPAVPFTAALSGRVSQSTGPGSGSAEVRIRATASGSGATLAGFRGTLDIALVGQADANGGLTMSASRVRFGPAAAPSEYTGRIVGLNGTVMTARVRDLAGHQLLLGIALQADGNAITGTVRVSPVRGGDDGASDDEGGA